MGYGKISRDFQRRSSLVEITIVGKLLNSDKDSKADKPSTSKTSEKADDNPSA
jgi:hypothetical protein